MPIYPDQQKRTSVTFSGREIDLANPKVSDVCIDDIAHSLAFQCRYGGHCREFLSIAEHSVVVSLHVPQHLALHGLLHDAAEAYVQDLTRPLRAIVGSIHIPLEDKWLAVLESFFGMTGLVDMPAAVKAVDQSAIATEMRGNHAALPAWMKEIHDGYGYLTCPPWIDEHGYRSPLYWPPHTAEEKFLARFEALTIG